MTPSQYEHAVASYFTAKGYDARVTTFTNDAGVDVFAKKGEERLAVQAKMYGGSARAVNRETMFLLQGAKDYFDCTKAVLVTDGEVTDRANAVAQKLGIDVLHRTGEQLLAATRTAISSLPAKSEFDAMWERYIMPLAGRTITSQRGLTNRIVKVDWGGVQRITSKSNLNNLPIEAFRRTVAHLFREGRVTRKVVNQEYVNRGSSGVLLILSQVPLFEYGEHPQPHIKLRKQLAHR